MSVVALVGWLIVAVELPRVCFHLKVTDPLASDPLPVSFAELLVGDITLNAGPASTVGVLVAVATNKAPDAVLLRSGSVNASFLQLIKGSDAIATTKNGNMIMAPLFSE